MLMSPSSGWIRTNLNWPPNIRTVLIIMLGFAFPRLRQQNSNWNASSVKQLQIVLFPLFYLKKTNSVPIITNNGVCLRVWAVYLNTKRGSKDRFCLTTENVCTCVRMCITTTKHECVCVYLLGGCIYSPFSCCYDSPVSHRPERRADLRKSGTPLCHFTVRHGARQVGCVTSSLRESYSRWHRSQRVLDNEKDDSNSLMCHGQYET